MGELEKWKREKKKEKQVFAPDGTMHLSVKMTSDIPKKRCGLGKFSCVKERKKKALKKRVVDETGVNGTGQGAQQHT